VASSTASGQGQVNANINVTPMIDVMLVLLIIFMIVTPLLEAGFKATLPSGANVEQSPENDDQITLGLDISGNYFLNKQPMSKEDVEKALTADYATRTQDKLLYFKADENLKYSKVQEAVEIARRAGARVLVAITEKSGGLMGDDDKKKGK
jgi:biopolymer transport protein ExbD